MTLGRSEKRPELQALRAVAVVLVVIFHLWPKVLTGGFVGVDVFFVLSGFLITSHLLREVARTGSVDLPRFWARRIRRLLPAAFTVLIASLAAMILWLPRSMWQQTLEEVGASGLYVVNWLLAFNAVDYMAADNTPSIVQHFWSLSVEEQFYIVWPVLIAIAIAVAAFIARRRHTENADRMRATLTSVAITLGLVALASFVFSVLETSRSQPSAYFITPTRAWEFAAGGLLAFVPEGLPSRIPASTCTAIRSFASWAGLAMIGVAAVRFSGDSAFPGYIALLPVAGSILVIWAGYVRHAWAPTAVADFGPIQLTGDVSYAIYLWHWPLILLYPILRGHAPELKGGLLIIGLSILLAYATKRLVEDPVRTGVYWTGSRRHSFALAGALMLITMTLVGTGLFRLDQDRQAQKAGLEAGLKGRIPCFGAAAMEPGSACPNPFAVPSDFDPAYGSRDVTKLDSPTCRTPADSATVLVCTVGDPQGQVAIAVIGNSHAGSLANGLGVYAQERGWRLDTYIRLECQGVALQQVSGYPAASCVSWTDEVINRVATDPTIAIVVFQSYYLMVPKEFNQAQRDQYEGAIQRTLERLQGAGKKVVVVGDVPGMRPDLGPDCVGARLHTYDPCSKPLAKSFTTNLLLQAASAMPDVKVIDVLRYFCDTKRCHSIIGGVLVYRDAHHMTATYSVTLAQLVGPQLGQLLGG